MRKLVTIALSIALAGCHSLGDAGVKEVQGEGAAHAGYRRLIEATLRGEPTVDADGVVIADGVSQQDLDETPRPVVVLLRNVVRALYDSGMAWDAVAFDTDLGPDPATLPPVHLPPITQAGWDVAPVESEH